MKGWIFLLVMDLLIPALMSGVGLKFLKNPPTDMEHGARIRFINRQETQESWIFTHKYAGKLWSLYGLIMLPVVILIYVTLFGADFEKIEVYACIIGILECVLLIGTVRPIRKAVENNFDEEGNPKQG